MDKACLPIFSYLIEYSYGVTISIEFLHLVVAVQYINIVQVIDSKINKISF